MTELKSQVQNAQLFQHTVPFKLIEWHILNKSTGSNDELQCTLCDNKHKRMSCPACKKCKLCGKRNHLAIGCFESDNDFIDTVLASLTRQNRS